MLQCIWPCNNTFVRRSRSTLSNVSPLQLLNLVVYATLEGNWWRWIVHGECLLWKLNVTWGMQKVCCSKEVLIRWIMVTLHAIIQLILDDSWPAPCWCQDSSWWSRCSHILDAAGGLVYCFLVVGKGSRQWWQEGLQVQASRFPRWYQNYSMWL